MQKRTVVFGTYDTALYGWTLTSCKLSDPEQKINYVDKPNGDGSWDLSTTMTDGIPRYKDRKLTVTLECSEGTRDDREDLISGMVNKLDGLEWHIILPDKPNHYLVGRVHVAVNYSDLAHAAVTVTATVKPWFFRIIETVISHAFEMSTGTNIYFTVGGRMPVLPKLTVTGDDVELIITFAPDSTGDFDGMDWDDLSVGPGEYTFPSPLKPGRSYGLNYMNLGGAPGTLTISYREAVLR